MVRIALLMLFCLMPGAARADWHEASSAHFVIYSDDRPERLRRFAEGLEQFDKALRITFGVDDVPVSPSSRVTVFVVNNTGAVSRLARDSYVAGFFIPRASGSIAVVPRVTVGGKATMGTQAVLQHEYAHYFMVSTWPDTAFPNWFIEGFAEFAATAKVADDSMILGMPPLYRAYSLFDSRALPARRMLGAQPERMTPEQIGILYGRGWLLTHYMMLDRERTGRMTAYIRALNKGSTPEEAALPAFGDPDKLDRALDAYIGRSRLPALRIPTSHLAIGDIRVRALTAAESATMTVRIQSAVGVDAQSAPKVAAAARTATAPFPADAVAQVVLAEAELDAGFFDAARAAADRALAADPRSVPALLLRGRAEAAAAARQGVTDPARWKAIRRFYLTANRIETEYAEPLARYHESFGLAGEPANDNAESGLLYAHVLAPYDPGLRFAAARIHLARNDLKAARTAVAPLAYAPHGRQRTAFARKIVDAIDRSEKAAALDLIGEGVSRDDDDE